MGTVCVASFYLILSMHVVLLVRTDFKTKINIKLHKTSMCMSKDHTITMNTVYLKSTKVNNTVFKVEAFLKQQILTAHVVHLEIHTHHHI